ncbi:DNA-directed DNA polymerase epsilon, subunit B [Knufia obscura]|uniref:DNA polymerase epsilon subunit B n=1 Tax=Knufia obscura TaxID=1635080 RepID=A0ABR0RZN3_9EURO|nr:DNA-directed DNA polymerase epsilon, subunit B [Knufia obscura]
MEEPISTPLPAHIFRAGPLPAKDVPFSSPGFATPAHPIRPRETRPIPAIEKPAFAPQLKPNNAQTVLPIILPPQTLRPVAFRTLTKKHNLTITSSGLGALANFVGKFCGERWRQEGLAERVLDEIAKQWKRDNGGLILDDGHDKKLKNILKSLEPCMSGGKLDVTRLSRSNNTVGSLSRSDSLLNRPDVSRDDSQASLGISGLDVQDEEMEEDDTTHEDARAYLKVVSAFNQPRLAYSVSKKTLELNTSTATLMPPIHHKIAAFRNRYHLVHQRLLRNESFQNTTFSKTTGVSTLSRSASTMASTTGAYKITPISNLLGRSGSSHLLLGLLVHSAAGDLSVTDLTGSTVLDISTARPIPDEDAWFCPGMIVLVEGTYDDDGSNNSNLGSAGGVGGQIRGRFVVDTIAGPPAERREVTLGTGHNHKIDAIHTVAGAGYGWFDFLGTGSEKALGQQMRRVQRRVLGHKDNNPENEDSRRTKVIMIGECTLDNPRTLEAIKAILNSQLASDEPSDRPLTVVLLGNFVSAASMVGSAKGGDSIHYKEAFDNLASVLSEFPSLLSTTTFVFVPGDNDPWASSFSAGAATLLPRQGIPELFTSRIRRAINNANTEANLKKDIDTPGEAIFTSNPARLSLFGPVEEIVLFRDDITSRIRRNAILFPKQEQDEEMADENDITQIHPDTEMPDPDIEAVASHVPSAANTTANSNAIDKPTFIGRRVTKLLLDQSHLAPFPNSIRPTLWDFSHSLSLYPLPTALCVCDAEAPAFCVTYEGCHVFNPGRVVEGGSGAGATRRGGGLARWVEYDVGRRRGEVREVRF